MIDGKNLFRAKHIHASKENGHLDGRWVEGYLSDKNYINSPGLGGEFLIDEKTICRNTEMTDKDGRGYGRTTLLKYVAEATRR